ncbi:hypothetical protein MOO45_02260 [Bombilactobacillus folatiphilus]|uniref:Competence protein ComGE n=1 Tax=Bombilactobacillus folatiphilus TaxID=2923362 RepID=A0ABY4PB38_9LACO|nr:hypothetical protein [Bombilactobacillus folatiphilus]UQS82497.1 hypothetical protein MOO45_02260 [Bombilactobacillus folatiphilus]
MHKNQHKAFLLLDSMLGFFLVLQAISIIPLCILPTQDKLHHEEIRTGLKIALYQKIKHRDLTKCTLDNRLYDLTQRGSTIEAKYQKEKLIYNLQTKTFSFFTQ